MASLSMLGVAAVAAAPPDARRRSLFRALLFSAGAGFALNAGAVEADTRDAKALIARAIALEHGEGVQQDRVAAAELYCRAAKMGDADAQFALGWMYANGRGIQRDDAVAAALFRKAADRGNVHAARMLRFVDASSAVMPACMRPRPVVRQVIADAGADENQIHRDLPPEQRKIVDLVRQLAPEYKVSPELALAVIQVESNFNARARSARNAQGLMQLIPETARRFNVRDPYDPVQNIRGGLAYLRWLLSYFRGNVALVAAGYNAGEGAVDRYRGIPPYKETRGYVKRILEYFKREVHPYDERVTDPSPQIKRLGEQVRAPRPG